MLIFIWTQVGGITNEDPDDGGVAVVAKSLERARELLAATDGVSPPQNKPYDPFSPEPAPKDPCDAFTREPDAFYPLANEPEERVFIFPNAGYC